MLNKINENNSLLEKINGKISTSDRNYYPFFAAISAIDNNNEMQREIFNSLGVDGTVGVNIIKLYSCLQGLFVSIDSLYSLSYLLTNSKNYININQNKQLRELKYIRNDVVGHPVRRIYEDSKIGYCVLRKDLITSDSFKYYIYFNAEIKAREIKLIDLINSYYEETNRFLYRLSNVKTDEEGTAALLQTIRKIYKKFNSGDDIRDELVELKSLFNLLNKDFTKKDHRFLWRIDLLIKLSNSFADDRDHYEVLDFCSGYQLTKLFSTVALDGEEIPNTKKVPKILVSLFKMMQKNEALCDLVGYLYDMSHPLFLSTFEKYVDYAARNAFQPALKYLELIKKAYDKNDSDMVYCYGVVLKTFKK